MDAGVLSEGMLLKAFPTARPADDEVDEVGRRNTRSDAENFEHRMR